MSDFFSVGGPKHYSVINRVGGFLTPLTTEEEARRIARKAVAGRSGMDEDEVIVVKVEPVSKVRTKAFDDVETQEVESIPLASAPPILADSSDG